MFREIVSMHPVKDPHNMKAIHHFYKTLEFEERYEELFDLMSYTNQLCRSLPDSLVPPAFISTGCSLRIHQEGEKGGAGRSYLVNRSTAVVANPADIYDDTHWAFFTRDREFDISPRSPTLPMRLTLQAELNHVEGLLKDLLSKRSDTRDYVLEGISQGHVRFLPTTGRELRLRLKLIGKSERDRTKFVSVRLLQQMSREIAVSLEPAIVRPIHVLLPLLSVDDRFREFLKNFVNQGLKKGVTLSLVVIIFSEINSDLVESIVKQLTRGFSKAVVTVAISQGQYSFPRAVEMGMSLIKRDDIAFITDVSVRVKAEFWSRCRDHARQGQQVYFPTPFSVFTSDYRTPLINNTYSYPISELTGQWAFYSFKSVCIVRRDYEGVSGYKGITSSGYFFQRVSESKLEVFRGPDPGLYQLWPTRTCRSLNSPTKRKDCETLLKSHAHFHPADLTEFLLGQDKNPPSKL